MAVSRLVQAALRNLCGIGPARRRSVCPRSSGNEKQSNWGIQMKKFFLAVAAAGILAFAVSATPAGAAPAIGLHKPLVESNTVNARCHHHRWSSRWHCYRRHRHYAPHYYYQPYYAPQPFFAAPFYFHHHHRHHRRHRHW
jgi:hypothetical protein